MVTEYGRMLAAKDRDGGQGPNDLGLIDLQRGQPDDLGPQPSGALASLHDADRTEARGLSRCRDARFAEKTLRLPSDLGP